MNTIAIIGAGISGIAAAHYALQKGWRVDLYEAGDGIGGRIGPTTLLGRPVEFGGKNIGYRYRRFRQFTASVGDQGFEEFGFNSSREVDGRVARLNKEGSPLRTLRQLHRLCGTRGLMQLLPHAVALLRDREQGFLDTPYFNARARRGDDQPLAEHFSPRCVEHFVRTLTVRMNGAEPDECWIGNFGSNLGLALDRYEQLQDGMGGLLDGFRAMNGDIDWLTEQRVLGLEQSNGETEVISHGKDGELRRVYPRVIVALPALQAARLFETQAPALSERLSEISYHPVAVAVARYAQPIFSPGQRAMVFDPGLPLSNAGAYGINDLDLVRYTFSGRTARQHIGPETPAEEAMALAERTVARHFPAASEGRLGFVYRHMAIGLCAYSAHHGQRLEAIRKASPSGIALTGDYRRGASIEACFRAAEEAVAQLNG